MYIKITKLLTAYHERQSEIQNDVIQLQKDGWIKIDNNSRLYIPNHKLQEGQVRYNNCNIYKDETYENSYYILMTKWEKSE